MNDSTRILAAVEDDRLWLRIEGPAMADDCPALRAFCESNLTKERPTLCVILECCKHFDSTFLGTLLCLQKLHGKAGGESVVLVTPAESCHQALKRMGAHMLFPITTCEQPQDAEWVLIAGEPVARESYEFQRQVLDAHVELAAVPGPLGELYQPIARMAEQQFESHQAASGRP